MRPSLMPCVLLLAAGCAGTEATDEGGSTGLAPSEPVRFGFPIADPGLIAGTVVGMDHDPEVHDENALSAVICTNFDGNTFPSCYDEHDGSDFLLADGFDAMDSGSSLVLAGADGVVVGVEDGHYDRCHAELDGISCDGHEIIANHVILEHSGGLRSLYWHLMKDSVLVSVGDELLCGEPLGTIGSSGISSGPHLHFEVQDSDEFTFDPFAGPFSQEESWWDEQRAPPELPGPGCTAL
jgi:hypothetical protein